jgi:hypothetical protein
MNMKKILTLVSATALTLGLTACGDTGTDADSADFSVTVAEEKDDDGQYEVTASLSEEIEIATIKFTVTKDGETDEAVTYYNCGNENPCTDTVDKTTDGYSEFIEGLCNADYKVTVEIKDADGETLTSTKSFTVADLAECTDEPVSSSDNGSSSVVIEDADLTAKSEALTLGAQKASAGSAVDLDAWTVYSSSQRKDHYAKLDLGYGVGASGPILFTPFYGEGVYGTWCTDGDSCNDVELYETDLNADSFAEVDKLSELLAAVQESGAEVESVAVEPGTVVLVLTEELDAETGAGIFLVLVDTQTNATDAGSITIKGVTK